MINRKNRLYYPFIPTIVIDDFFESPHTVREFALNQDFFKGDRGTWPGIRTEFLEKLGGDVLEILIFKILKNYPQFQRFEKFESTFQLINENYISGWMHDDAPDLNLAGFVYLSPNPPINTGTTFYADNDVVLDKFLPAFMDDVCRPPEDPPRVELQKYKQDQKSSFFPTITVDNVFNRCVIFDPRTWHCADNFFGTTKEDTRLTLVFFARGV